MKTRNIAIVAVAAMLLTTTAISTSASTYSAFAYRKNQATSLANACGNDFLPANVGCQNTDSQIQGDENGVALTAQQTFSEVEEKKEKVKPVPPTDIGCPEDTVWDITVRENPGVPIGTIICLFHGLGNNIAEVHEPGEDPYPANVDTNLITNTRSCDAQIAQVTSGTPPNPLEMGSILCAEVSDPVTEEPLEG